MGKFKFINVNFRSLTGRHEVLEVPLCTRVWEVKYLLCEQVGAKILPKSNLTLLHHNVVLMDYHSLEEAGVSHNDTITVLVNLSAGKVVVGEEEDD